jgi:hypothetical protein
MNHSVFAAVLFSGWLLMTPPVEKDAKAPGGYAVRDDLPVASWRHASSYDQANDCEKDKWAIHRNSAEIAIGLSGKADVSDNPYVWMTERARCVPADHIYPPKPPSK